MASGPSPFLQPHGTDGQTLGREIVRSLQVALRTIRTHGWHNEASAGALDYLVASFNQAVEVRSTFGVHVAGDYLFIDEDRLKTDASGYGIFEHLIRELTVRGLGSIFVHGVVHLADVTALLEAFLAVPDDGSAVEGAEVVERINRQMEERKAVFTVGPLKNHDNLDNVRDVDRRERAKKAFFKAVTVARAVLTSAHLNKRLDLRHAKRVVQNMVDLIMEEEFSLLGLTTLKDYDNYTFYHSVNVCIYSLALGKRVGLTRAQLSELGVAALLHDIGKTKIPVDLLRKRGAFTADEMEIMKHHPELGVRELVKMRGLSSLAFKSMVASFEHHLNFDPGLPGYPAIRRPFKPHVIGRIVAIADCFDAMTTKRCYAPRAITRDKALAFMLSQAGQKFDPVLVKVFANLVGVFPVGTLVRLRSGRLAVVTRAASESSLCHRPTVKPITNEHGFEMEQAEIDLAAPGSEGGGLDEIVGAVNGEELGIDTGRYFV